MVCENFAVNDEKEKEEKKVNPLRLPYLLGRPIRFKHP
jgi:hypothetical protein